jgi:hypothetical protein
MRSIVGVDRHASARHRKTYAPAHGLRPVAGRIGTTQPFASRRITTWLPLWRSLKNPNRSKARCASAPETRGSLGITGGGNGEHGHHRVAR